MPYFDDLAKSAEKRERSGDFDGALTFYFAAITNAELFAKNISSGDKYSDAMKKIKRYARKCVQIIGKHHSDEPDYHNLVGALREKYHV